MTNEKKPRAHAELIKAWADGAEIEFWSHAHNCWRDARVPTWHYTTTYRIKPVDVVEYLNISLTSTFKGGLDNNLKLTFCGTTGKLKTAEVIG